MTKEDLEEIRGVIREELERMGLEEPKSAFAAIPPCEGACGWIHTGNCPKWEGYPK